MSAIETKAFGALTVKDAEKGEVVAIVATLGVVDRDGDVLLAGAIGTARVQMSGYGHDIVLNNAAPVGKGTVSEEGNKAVFRGNFFLSTERGRDSFHTTRELGADGQWSFGSLKDNIKTAELTNEWRTRGARRLVTGMVPLEVSPVFIGAGIGTGTLAAKASTIETAQQKAARVREAADIAVLREPRGRLVLDVVAKATRWISNGTVQIPPGVKLFDPSDYPDRRGFYTMKDPHAIYVARHLTDEDLIEVIGHEVGHWHRFFDSSESLADYDGKMVLERYLQSSEALI